MVAGTPALPISLVANTSKTKIEIISVKRTLAGHGSYIPATVLHVATMQKERAKQKEK